MTWQPHTERGQCASVGCGKLAVWRFEAGGVGSVYCDDCKHAADDHLADCVDLDEADQEEWDLMGVQHGPRWSVRAGGVRMVRLRVPPHEVYSRRDAAGS
jgi:hypothetical protein